MSIYLDASILVSLFVRDDHTPRIFGWMGALTEPVLVSSWAETEFSSALGMRRRVGSLEREARDESELMLDRWLDSGVARIEPVMADFAFARGIMRAERAPLKAPDALHIAMALRSRSVLATTDRQLRRAAEALGLTTDAP